MKFELDNYNRNTPDETLIADLKRVANDLGKSPTIDEYNERGTYHATTITRRLRRSKLPDWKKREAH